MTSEVKKLVEEAYNEALRILSENRGKLWKCWPSELLDREVLDAEQINLIVAGKEVATFRATTVTRARARPRPRAGPERMMKTGRR